MNARTVVQHRYARPGQRTRRTLWDALRYMQRRPLGPDERPGDRALFAERTEGLSREGARALLLAHVGRQVAYHRLIVSPGTPVTDLQRWTRRAMADLSRHLGQDLRWVAVIHRNTAHPHVHLLLAGAAARLQGGGRPLPVRLGPEEYALLREAGDRHARAQAQEERNLAAAVRAELDLLDADRAQSQPYRAASLPDLRRVEDRTTHTRSAGTALAQALAWEAADEGLQMHKHLREEPEQRGAPGQDATRGH